MHPLESVHLDYLTIELLVTTDYFVWYVQTPVTSSQTVKCTAQALWDRFIVYYCLPENIVSE